MADHRGDVRAVEKGSRIPINASLRRADWNKNAYVRYGGRKQQATVQLKAAGSDMWVPVNRELLAKGRIATHVTVKRESRATAATG